MDTNPKPQDKRYIGEFKIIILSLIHHEDYIYPFNTYKSNVFDVAIINVTQ